MEGQHNDQSDFTNEINKALHTMAAHLHRYGSELGGLERTVQDIRDCCERFRSLQPPNALQTDCDTQENSTLSFSQVISQLRAMNSFRRELEHKTTNILALVSPIYNN